MIVIQNYIEQKILDDPEFIAGLEWGKPRRGHPEGKVGLHIEEVLANVDKYASSREEWNRLRLIALIHDTFKYKVDRSMPKSGENHHGMIARRFAEKYIDDEGVLDVIELHDEAFNAWSRADRYGHGHWTKAERRLERLIERLGSNLSLYIKFYLCDNETGNKGNAGYNWFVARVVATGNWPGDYK